jgi:hypothetical protein
VAAVRQGEDKRAGGATTAQEELEIAKLGISSKIIDRRWILIIVPVENESYTNRILFRLKMKHMLIQIMAGSKQLNNFRCA